MRVPGLIAAMLLAAAVLAGCKGRPGPAVEAPPPVPAQPQTQAPSPAPAASSQAEARDDADARAFAEWMETHPVGDFEAYLAEDGANGVLPTRDLVRTATDWRQCGGPRFELPPRDHWPAAREVVRLVGELKKRGIVKDVEGASAYRNPRLNACAHGAPRSAHAASFALDITADPGQVDVPRLCRFWRDEGRAWKMGLSRYPSGRIHLDVSGWRTWGADHTRKTSFCLKLLQDDG